MCIRLPVKDNWLQDGSNKGILCVGNNNLIVFFFFVVDCIHFHYQQIPHVNTENEKENINDEFNIKKKSNLPGFFIGLGNELYGTDVMKSNLQATFFYAQHSVTKPSLTFFVVLKSFKCEHVSLDGFTIISIICNEIKSIRLPTYIFRFI